MGRIVLFTDPQFMYIDAYSAVEVYPEAEKIVFSFPHTKKDKLPQQIKIRGIDLVLDRSYNKILDGDRVFIHRYSYIDEKLLDGQQVTLICDKHTHALVNHLSKNNKIYLGPEPKNLFKIGLRRLLSKEIDNRSDRFAVFREIKESDAKYIYLEQSPAPYGSITKSGDEPVILHVTNGDENLYRIHKANSESLELDYMRYNHVSKMYRCVELTPENIEHLRRALASLDMYYNFL